MGCLTHCLSGDLILYSWTTGCVHTEWALFSWPPPRASVYEQPEVSPLTSHIPGLTGISQPSHAQTHTSTAQVALLAHRLCHCDNRSRPTTWRLCALSQTARHWVRGRNSETPAQYWGRQSPLRLKASHVLTWCTPLISKSNHSRRTYTVHQPDPCNNKRV